MLLGSFAIVLFLTIYMTYAMGKKKTYSIFLQIIFTLIFSVVCFFLLSIPMFFELMGMGFAPENKASAWTPLLSFIVLVLSSVSIVLCFRPSLRNWNTTTRFGMLLPVIFAYVKLSMLML